MQVTRPVRHALLLAFVSLAALAAADRSGLTLRATPAHALDATVTLDNVVTKNKKGDTITIRRAEFVNTNLTKDEVSKLLDPTTADNDRVALLSKLKASQISVPEMKIEGAEGVGSLRDLQATNVDQGKVAKASIGGFDADIKDKNQPIRMKSGPIAIENADFATLVKAVETADPSAVQATIGRFTWTGLDINASEKGTPAGPDNFIKMRMASFDLVNTMDKGVFKSGKLEMKSFVIEPGKATKMMRDIAPLGYDKLDLGMTFGGSYDQASKALKIDDLTVSGVNMGSIGVKALFGGIDAAAFGKDKMAQRAALLSGDVASLDVKYVNSGMFEKALTILAAQQKKKPDDLRKEWSTMAGQVLPAVLGGDPSALKIAGEIQKFLGSPKSLLIQAKAKAGAVKFLELAQIKDPASLLQKVSLSATANQ